MIFSDEYIDDESFFEQPAKFAYLLDQTEWDVLLNYRAYAKGLTCMIPDCDEPIWAIKAKLITGWERSSSTSIARLLVQYTCSSCHDCQYEAIPLYTKSYSGVY